MKVSTRMTQSLLLQAFQGTNTTIPVWFMRQAGRYLPQYQALRKKYSLKEMFRHPEIAATVTVLPVKELKVDAAILFADILTLPSAMGFDIRFDKDNGPLVKNPLTKPSDVEAIHDFADLSYIREIVALVNQRLPEDIPLIGFAGSPFSVACYLLEGAAPLWGPSALGFNKALHFIERETVAFHKLMRVLTQNTIRYLHLQKDAGIKVFQIFDTWAGLLRPADYARWVFPYVQEIFQGVDLPSIYYVKNSHPLLAFMERSGADFLSVCQSVVLGHNSLLEKTDKGIQGNLFNGLLYADNKTLEKEIRDVLMGVRHYKRYVFNLSHGVLPDAAVDTLKFIVDHVHEFDWMRKDDRVKI